jgi:DNA segregation ATPase FtsK/SpoIIIE, S-DNA-T family
MLRFVALSLLLIAVIGGLVYWQWTPISSWVDRTVTGVTQVFGWGLVLLALIVLTLWIVFLNKPRMLLTYWNRWLGMIVLFLAVWGMLSFFKGSGTLEEFSQGGKIGESITHHGGVAGVFIVLALLIAGAFLVVPRGFARLVANIFSWLISRLKKEPVSGAPNIAPATTVHARKDEISEPFPRYKSPAVKPPPAANHSPWLWNKLHKQSSPAPVEGVTTGPVKKAEVAEATPEGPESGDAETASKPDAKQVAQEVWKKYGESPSQVTSDGWRLPAVEILDHTPEVEFSQADNLKKAKLIEESLASYGVEAKVVQINVGPTVTQFGIEPGWDRKMKEVKEKDRNGDVRVKTEEIAKTRVKVDRITSLANDLALVLAAPSIRIEAPVPGKSVVGIEVPNNTSAVVSLRSVVESNVFQKMEARTKMATALGKGAGGESVVGDLTKMPHLLIAGATGSGKTVCIHSIICCLLLYNTPGDLKFIMIDPKRVELTSYNSIPHLATPVIVDTEKALSALRWLSQEMDKRYQTLAAARARNIEAYNKGRQTGKLPYLVLVIDELADLMMTAGDEVEHTLCRLAQLARATGIHLIVATQRPSVDVVTGLIKANFPTRISFAVTSQVDSRTILDIGGAEKLLGKGDMLYAPTEAAKPKRLQGCFVSDPETERIVYFWGNQRREDSSQLKLDDIISLGASSRQDNIPPDPLMEEVRKLAKEHGHISASFLQRHMRIGYPRAARLMEQLEEEGTGDEEGENETG